MYIFELCMIVKLWIGYFRIKQNKKQHNHRFLNKIVLAKRRLHLDKSISFLQMKKESSMTNELLIFSRQTCMWSVRTSLASRSTQSTTIIVWQCQRILRLAVAEHQKKTCMAAPSVARALRRRRRRRRRVPSHEPERKGLSLFVLLPTTGFPLATLCSTQTRRSYRAYPLPYYYYT